MTTFLFPGQGSQARGMGANLFKDFPELVNIANDILGYDIEQLCTLDPNNVLNNTEYTQPALFTVNALTFLKHTQDTNQKADYLVGHSLGEYDALFAAKVFDFATGLKLVQKRGQLMSMAKDGAMPTPLPHTVPFAPLSNARQCPSGERIIPSLYK